ncbi:unnamed protein product [Closterium sp. NIES-54]
MQDETQAHGAPTSRRRETKNLLKERNKVRPRPRSASRTSRNSTSIPSVRSPTPLAPPTPPAPPAAPVAPTPAPQGAPAPAAPPTQAPPAPASPGAPAPTRPQLQKTQGTARGDSLSADKSRTNARDPQTRNADASPTFPVHRKVGEVSGTETRG